MYIAMWAAIIYPYTTLPFPYKRTTTAILSHVSWWVWNDDNYEMYSELNNPNSPHSLINTILSMALAVQKQPDSKSIKNNNSDLEISFNKKKIRVFFMDYFTQGHC